MGGLLSGAEVGVDGLSGPKPALLLTLRKGALSGTFRLPEVDVAPGLARPACSFCSSVQDSKALMRPRIWNFLGSDRSRARNCRKWFVTRLRSTVSSGFARRRNRRAFVRWSFSITASWRSLPIKSDFSLSSFSSGPRRSSSAFEVDRES